METLTEIVKSILVIIIMASFLELLLPEGGLKPFVRFSIGLFILLAVLNPVLSFLYKDQHLEVNLWNYRMASDESQDVLEKGKSLNKKITASSNTEMQEKIEGQISSIAALVPGVKDVETDVQLNEDGSPQKLQITVRPGREAADRENSKVPVFSAGQASISDVEKEEIQGKIKSLISSLYSFSDQDIEVQFERR